MFTKQAFPRTAGFTFTQADVFNALERMADGCPVYDGYVPGGTNGPSDLNFGLTAAGALPPGDARVQMQPRDVPVIQTRMHPSAIHQRTGRPRARGS